MRRMKILGRFLLTSSVVFGISTIANWNEWNQYWNGTLRRVQTVDFNILSHTLPTKLSSVLANKNYQELQRTLDSNYGLFGIVVTDCKKVDSLCQEQKIIFASNGRRDWKTSPESNNLSNHPFDLLRTPSPLVTERGYKSPSSQEQIFTKESNKGIVIGRVYYIRGTAPDFLSDYTSWLRNIWSIKGSHGFYALKAGALIGIGIAVWLSIEFLLYKRYSEQQQAIQEQERLQRELNKEISRNSELLAHQESLISQRERTRNDLRYSRETYQQHVEELSTEIAQLTSSQSQQQSNLQAITQLLTIRQDELNVAYASGNFTEEQLLYKENEIAQLQQQIDELEHQNQQITIALSASQRSLDVIRLRLDDANRQIQNLERQINALSFERDRSLREVDDLREKLATALSVTGLTLVLKAAQLETVRTEKLHEENMRFFESLYEKLEEENSSLKSKQAALQLKVEDLEGQLTLLESTDDRSETLVPDPSIILPLDSLTELPSDESNLLSIDSLVCQTERSIIDLSSTTIALVGGDNHIRRKIIQRLSAVYNLKEIREVLPKWEKKSDSDSVKVVIRDCDLIAVLTGQVDHGLTDIISKLRKKSDLQGEIIYIDTIGISNISRKISDHLDRLKCNLN